MKLFNEFLNESRNSGALTITHVRLGAQTPVVELFAQKMAEVVRKVAPTIAITINKPVSLLKAADNTVRSLATAQTASEAAKIQPMQTWSRLVTSAMIASNALDAVSQEPSKAELLDQFAALHVQAFDKYAQNMTSAPAFGFGIAAGLTSHAASKVSNLEPILALSVDFNRCANSVYMTSFADTHAITSYACKAGPKQALAMAQAALEHRLSSGDFDRFSQSPQSSDTQGALEMVIAELQGGAIYGNLGHSDLVKHAMCVASENVGAWLCKHGTPPELADSLSHSLDNFGSGLQSASLKLQAKQANTASADTVPSQDATPQALDSAQQRNRNRLGGV